MQAATWEVAIALRRRVMTRDIWRSWGMDEKRRSPRRRVLKSATIVFNHNRSVVSCILRNLSDDGALLKVENSVTIPERFVLRFDGQIVECVSVRRTLTEIAVKFDRNPAR
jgi:hypothetical protein